MIQLPRLLDKQLREVARLHPSRLSATDKLEPTSTATMGLPHGEPSVGLRDFVELFDSDGSKGIYRVEGINASNGERQTVNLSHGIVTLEDYIMPPDANLQGSIKAMLAAVLAQQVEQLWTLGDVEVPEEEVYTVNAGNAIALQAIINIASLVPEFAFSYDQSVTPWVLHFRKREQAPSCECRLSRNMSNISVSFSPQEMCTRVTSDLLPNGYMDADNVAEWGAIVRELPIESDTTPDEALVLAEKYLDQHKHPTTTIEIEAIDLSKLTGENLDALILGRLCRVALPDWGVTYDHQIVSVYWADLIGKPQQKKLSLATRKKRAEMALAQAVQAKNQASRNYKHIRETENSVLIQAEKIALLGEEIKLKATKNEVDGAITRISAVEIDLDAAKATIALKADRTEYNDLETRVTSAEINIDGANAAIQLKADQTLVTEQGQRISDAEIAIDGANAQIKLKASQEDVTKLEDDLGGVTTRLSQAEIDIDGANAAIKLTATKTEVDALSGRVTATEGELSVQSDKIYAAVGEINRLNGDLADVTGSTLWLTRNNITGVVGRISVGADGKLYIQEGSGLMVYENGAAYGLYHENNLTAGLLVEKLNDGSTAAVIAADRLDLRAYVTATALEANYAKIADLDAVTASISNLTSGLTTAFALRSSWLYSDNGVFTQLSADLFTLNGAGVSQRSITMGSVTSTGKALSTGGELDLQHSHAVSVSDDGTLQLGGVTAEGNGGNFNIAETQFFQDAVSAAASEVTLSTGSWTNGSITVSASNGATTTVSMPKIDLKKGTWTDANNIAVVPWHGAQQLDGIIMVDGSTVYKKGWNACLAACEETVQLYKITTDLTTTTLYYADGTAAGTGFARVLAVENTYFIPNAKE